MTKICCVCQRVQQGSSWEKQRERGAVGEERVTHGYCPLCFEESMAALLRSEMVSQARKKMAVSERYSVSCV